MPEQIEILERTLADAPSATPEDLARHGYIYDSSCGELEDNINKSLTDIVKATYVDSKCPEFVDRTIVHVFKVNESIRGEMTEDHIYVWQDAYSEECHDYKQIYEKDKSYLLLLTRYSDPFISFDTFKSIMPQLLIPLDGNGDPDISLSKRCERDLVGGAMSEELKTACENGQLISYLMRACEGNPSKITYKGFTETYDREFAIRNAEFVFEISAGPSYSRSDYNPHVTYVTLDKEKVKILKGNGELLLDTIYVLVPITIPRGKYIVAVNDADIYTINRVFVPSTRNSIYPISEKEDVLKIINDTGFLSP